MLKNLVRVAIAKRKDAKVEVSAATVSVLDFQI